MRAFTSLLGHILGSHPIINGYFELHISYDAPSALSKQLAELSKHEAVKDHSRYLFDKLLHNDYRLMPERLGIDDIKILVCLRDPRHSIKSIVNLFAQKQTDDPYERPEEATRYYIERIAHLCDFCSSHTRGYYYFDAEAVRQAPERLLSALARWLDLDSPLSDRYNTFSQTGKPRKGDSSPLIHSGEIDQSASDYSHVLLPRQLLQRATSAYREYRQTMIDNAGDRIIARHDLT